MEILRLCKVSISNYTLFTRNPIHFNVAYVCTCKYFKYKDIDKQRRIKDIPWKQQSKESWSAYSNIKVACRARTLSG